MASKRSPSPSRGKMSAPARPPKPARTKTKSPANRRPQFIVGIGGSAGSLEALEQFFSHMPPDQGIGFVLVPHLDPTHKGMMPELLQRCTRMPVVQAEDQMPVVANHIYIIPPNKDMSILSGALDLHEPAAPRGWRTPIDYFFRHLAEDQGERAVALVLSGMGTDGTLGIKAVKEHLGLAMVQETASAKFNSMPRNAIGTGLIDYVAPAEQLRLKVQIFATDIDKDAVDRARQGLYPPSIMHGVPAERLRRFFLKDDGMYRIHKQIREMVIFAPQNVIIDPPFTKIDLLTCRYHPIYFTAELQNKVILLFHYSLNPGGVLFLSSSETIGSFSDLFATVDNKWKIFRRRETNSLTRPSVDIRARLPNHEPVSFSGKTRKTDHASFPDVFRQVLIDRFAPASVLVTEAGDILYIHGIQPCRDSGRSSVHGRGVRFPGYRRGLEQRMRAGHGLRGGRHRRQVGCLPAGLSGPHHAHLIPASNKDSCSDDQTWRRQTSALDRHREDTREQLGPLSHCDRRDTGGRAGSRRTKLRNLIASSLY